MFCYPTDFPVDEAQAVGDALLGNLPPLEHGVRCCWVLAGYGLAQKFPDCCCDPDCPCTEDDKKAAGTLLKSTAHSVKAGIKTFPAIDWAKVLPLVIQLLQALMATAAKTKAGK